MFQNFSKKLTYVPEEGRSRPDWRSILPSNFQSIGYILNCIVLVARQLLAHLNFNDLLSLQSESIILVRWLCWRYCQTFCWIWTLVICLPLFCWTYQQPFTWLTMKFSCPDSNLHIWSVEQFIYGLNHIFSISNKLEDIHPHNFPLQWYVVLHKNMFSEQFSSLSTVATSSVLLRSTSDSSDFMALYKLLYLLTYNLRSHLYADDSQICSVANWMCSNRLQLNSAKTEILWPASIWFKSETVTRLCTPEQLMRYR